MNRYRHNLFCLLLFVATTSFAQSYREEIGAYREKYKQDFLEDERSPIKSKEDLQFIMFYDADSTYKVTGDFIKTEKAEPFELPTMNGKTKTYREYGKVLFKLHGKKLELKLYQNIALLENPEYKDHLFLPFTDETNGKETYGGGRYMNFETTDIKNNQLTIDFNKAYNPYCAFAGGYSCPKPPEENFLHVSIKSGEKKFGKGH